MQLGSTDEQDLLFFSWHPSYTTAVDALRAPCLPCLCLKTGISNSANMCNSTHILSSLLKHFRFHSKEPFYTSSYEFLVSVYISW